MNSSDRSHPMWEICEQWIRKIREGIKHKREKFQDTADECMRFFDGAHDFMYGGKKHGYGFSAEGERSIKTTFKMTTNKVAELVQLFGPYMYHTNPNRMVAPRIQKLPELAFALAGGPAAAQQIMQQYNQMQLVKRAVSELQEYVLNYTPHELGLRTESRRGINEALIKGRGLLNTELYYPPGSDRPMVGSFYLPVDDFVTDPDTRLAGEWKWIAVRCENPTWEVEREFGLSPRALKEHATTASTESKASVDADRLGDKKKTVGKTNDLIVYWKIYSKMGLGHYLRGVPERYTKTLDQFGLYTYLVVAPGVPYPLNLPPHVMNLDLTVPGNLETVLNQVRWPIPFYADGEWPVTWLDFHEVPDTSWPQAHMKSALGELKAINWILSFLTSKVAVNSRDLLVIAEELCDESIAKIESGDDYDTLMFKRSEAKRIEELVQFIQHPQMNHDIVEVLNILLGIFERRTGLNELLYGMTTKQMRSSAEASLKGDLVQIRINDMAECVEDWAGKVARKEGLATRIFQMGRDVAPVFGEVHDPEQGQYGILSDLWDRFVYVPWRPGDDATLERVVREYDYRIEAGSVRKPNHQTEMENMQMAAQAMMPNLFGFYQATGQPQQLNAFLTRWAKAHQMDVDEFLFPQLPPPGQLQEDPNEQQSQLSIAG